MVQYVLFKKTLAYLYLLLSSTAHAVMIPQVDYVTAFVPPASFRVVQLGKSKLVYQAMHASTILV
eukprot:3934299-Rhodomonas_salina.1